MKLQELIELIGDDVTIRVDGRKYQTSFPEDALVLEVKSVDIRTDMPKDTLESLGYSFEVGV